MNDMIITFVKMQLHSEDNDSADLPYVILYVDPVTFCVWIIVRNSRIWMACALHDSVDGN